MHLQDFELSEGTAATPIGGLIEQAERGGIQVRNSEGKVLAFIVQPDDEESLAYIDAYHDLQRHQDEIIAARSRRGGVTTQQLLENANNALRQIN
jgi:hypothetical protein